MPVAACPFCFKRVDTARLYYQCTSRGVQKCTQSEDKVREQLTSNATPSFPTFPPPAARNAEPACPTCGHVATLRACSVCHTAVPIDFVGSDSPLIGIVGSKGSGKTVLMTVLVKQLRETVGRRFQASVRMATDNPDGQKGVDDYKNGRENRLFEERKLPAQTSSNAVDRRSPVVLLWQGLRSGRLGRERTCSTIMSFIDTAGEDLANQQSTFTLNYLTVCDGLIVTLDPFALPGARARISLHRDAIQTGDGAPFDVLARITEVLRNELRVRPNKKIKIPVAVVFTKIDAFFPLLDRGNPIMAAPSAIPIYQQLEGEQIHEHVRALLHEWDAGDIDLHMRANYADFRFFAVSALGAEPDYASRAVADGGVRPHRVEDPVLWLMAKEGTVASA